MTARTRSQQVSRRRAAAGFAVVALMSTGCGSTSLRGYSPETGGLDAPSTTGGLDGTTSGSVDGSTGSTLDSSTGVVSDGSTGGSTGTSGTSGLGTTGTGGGSAGASSGTSGGGATSGGSATTTKKPLRVGIPYTDVTAVFAAFGKADDAPTDATAGTRKLIKYVNEHGGIGGRQISPVFHELSATSDEPTEAQKACQNFTLDNKVDVVYDQLGSKLLAACLAKSGIADFATANWLPDAADLQQTPNWMVPTAMRVDRQIQGLLRASVAAGRLVKGDKVGVMVDDCPYGHRTYDNVIVPFLKQLGASVTQSSLKCVTNLVADLAPLTNDVQRAVLAFSSAGVTNVIGLHGAEAFVIANFTSNAKQQNYFPKYLVTSNAYPWQNSSSEATIKIDASALPKMSGAGYLPLLDIGSGYKAVGEQKKVQDICTKIDPTQNGASSQKAYAKPFRQNLYYSGCHGLFTAKAVMEAAGMDLSYKTLRATYSALKQQGFVSAIFAGGRLGGPAASIDGVGFMQPFVYDTAKKTFVYSGAPVTVGS